MQLQLAPTIDTTLNLPHRADTDPSRDATGDYDHAIVLLSGGIDSATCAALATREADRVTPIHVDYGQQTNDVEHERALRLADEFDLPEPEVIDLTGPYQHFGAGVAGDRDSFTTDDGELTEDDGRSTGYVPMRNLMLLTTAAAYADKHDGDVVYHGAQMGDEADYPDCTPTFMDAASGAVNASLAEDDTLTIATPLIYLSKPNVLALGEELGVPFEYTYSCYSETDFDDPDPCGECPACEEREDAFAAAGLTDPVTT